MFKFSDLIVKIKNVVFTTEALEKKVEALEAHIEFLNVNSCEISRVLSQLAHEHNAIVQLLNGPQQDKNIDDSHSHQLLEESKIIDKRKLN